MLTDAYKAALRALKDQAIAAGAQILAKDRAVMKAELADAQRRIVEHDAECTLIARLLLSQPKDSDLTIETLTEERLVLELAQDAARSVTKEGVSVKRGQIWRDLDRRQQGRRCVVVAVVGGVARLAHAQDTSLKPRTTKVSIARMHKHSTGWALDSQG
jgi:hypothetical protein